MEEIDFYGEKELKRNRRFIVLGVSIFLVLLVSFILSAVTFGNFFKDTKNRLENTSGELEAQKLRYAGVKNDLDAISFDLNAVGDSDWQLNDQESDYSCKYGIQGTKRISIECYLSIESEIVVESQSELNGIIDEYRSLLNEGTYFSSLKSVSTYEYPNLIPSDSQEDLDSTVLFALSSKDQLTYNRWGVPYCHLIFKQNKNSVVGSGESNNSYFVVGILECSDTVNLNENGNNLPTK